LLACSGAGAVSGEYVVGLTSGFMIRGLMLGTGEDPALQLSANFYDDAEGWFGGVSGGTLGAPLAESQMVHMQGRFGRAWRLSADWGAEASYLYYAYPLDGWMHAAEHDEAGVTVTWRDLAFVTLSHHVVKPWTVRGHRYGAALDTVLRYPVVPALTAISGLGYVVLDDSVSRGYGYGQLGLVWHLGPVSLTAAYLVTSQRAEQLFGDRGTDRWVGSLLWEF
jgi:hypothetical protein